MKSSAAGQLFGYTLQFPRALLRLLEANPGSNVGIEVCGDVAVFSADGGVLSEEDKSSLLNNALTDHSKNLWKTFYNWIKAVNAGELNAEQDRFVLYTNHSVTDDSLVLLFHNTTETTAEETVQKSLKLLKDVKQKHAIFEYTDFVLNEQIGCFKKILPRFELVADHRADDVYRSIRNEIEKTAIEKNEVEWVLEGLTGWMQLAIMKKIAKQERAIVSKDSLLGQLRLLSGKIRRKECSCVRRRNWASRSRILR